MPWFFNKIHLFISLCLMMVFCRWLTGWTHLSQLKSILYFLCLHKAGIVRNLMLISWRSFRLCHKRRLDLTASCQRSFIKISVYHPHIVVPCNTTKECQIWNDGTYCAEGFENIKHTNKTCYCAMMSKLNRKTGACIGEFGNILGPLLTL